MIFATKLARLLAFVVLCVAAERSACAAPFAYISNSGSDNVSVIDTATYAVVATVPVGASPYGVAVNAGGAFAYVANFGGNTVSVIDTATNTVVSTVPVGGLPTAIALDPADTRVYVTNGGDGTVSVIDTASHTVVATIVVGATPQGVAVTPSGAFAYVTNTNSSTISIIGTADNSVVNTVPVGSGPVGIAISPDGSRAYVANQTSKDVSVINILTNNVVATVPLGTTPTGVVIDPSGARAYVTDSADRVVVIDVATNGVTTTIGTGSVPYGVAIDGAGSRLYVVNMGGNTVSVIDAASNTVVATIPVGSEPAANGRFIGGPSTDPPPTLMPAFTGLRPASGSTAGGSSVAIDGTNLDTVTSVTIGGAPATIDQSSATLLMVRAPAHAAGFVTVVVTNPSGSATQPGGFEYVENDSVARDYSIAVNPSPRWSYGWEPVRGGALSLYSSRIVDSGGNDVWLRSGDAPGVWRNSTASTANSATNSTPPGAFGMHPGPSGENSVARWTAPSTGTYRIEGAFIGLDYSYPTTTDVAILKNNTAASPLFSGAIGSYNVPLYFSVDVALAAGDTIEFTVGFGNGFYQGDATGLDAVITLLAAAPASDTVVINENGAGAGSLANAIAFVNANCATSKVITFNIPLPGVRQIQPLTPLPDLACSDMVIDGYSQPGASANTLDVGSNATILIEIDGTDISFSGGLRIAAPGVVIKGLSIHQFHDSPAITVTAPLGTFGIRVVGNFIGINAVGALRNNLHGVANNPGATGLSIGGASPWERNVISGNTGYGIYLQSGDFTYIDNNYIGLNPAGTAAIGNSGGGIRLAGTTNTQVTFNVVSGNATGGATAGIRDEGSYSYYAGNYVGTDATGVAAVPNDVGVHFLNSTNAIFGTGEGGNLVSGNSTIGVKVDSSTNMSLRGNYIGTDATSWASLPNNGAGVQISASSGVEVGGPPGNGNKITNNGGFGVNVASGQGNPILANSIFLNGSNNIALEGSRPANDACDVDTGANDLQNFPVLDSAVTGEGGTLMVGTVTGRANTTLRIEFFTQPSGTVTSGHVRSGRVRSGPVYQDFIGSTNVDTGPGCSAPLNATVGSGVPVGYTIVATATDPSNNTSAFSLPVTASAPSQPLSCNIFHTDLATGDAANTLTGDRIVTAGGALQLFVSCSDFTNATYAWSTGETTNLIAVTGPAAGATATYSITVTTDAGTATATKNLVGALTGTPSCTLTPSGSNPIPPGFIGPFNVDASCSPGATGYNWLNSGPEVIGGQETATATYQFAFTPSPGYGYTVQMTPSNASGQGPDATRLIWVQPFIVSPDGLGFPDTVAGTQSASQAVTIRNVSDYYQTYGSFVVTGPFTAVSHCPAPITAGTTCTVDVRFAPTGAGVEQVGYLTFSSGFPGNSDISVLLSGNGVPNVPHVTVTPKSLVFPARTVLTTSSPQTVTFTNPGPASVAIGGASITGDFAFTTSCGAVVPAEDGCTFQVTFTPLDVGSRTGTLTINSDAASSPDVISLAGSGLTTPVPAVALIPGTLDFAPQILGSTSAMQFATVSNDGSAPLVFGPITASGDYILALDFVSARGPCVTDLAPGASCEIGVAFHPTAAGLREGAITINTNAPDPVATVRLVGTGLFTAPPRMLSVPASLAFDPQRVGTTSAGRSVRITNNFTTPATITELSVTGDFSVSDTCTTIPARGSCSPLVTFQPRAVGERTGTLTIRALSEVSPYVVQLRGVGEVNPLPALMASISQAGFGNAFVGAAAQITFELRNIGQVPVVIDSIAPLGDFLASHACTTIPALGTCPVTIYFVPNGVGRRAGSLAIRSNAEGSPLRIDLSGTGCMIPSVSRSRFGGLLCGAP
jgi:YVTN family beta-propeller protein/parallel beta-helix repeat protein